MTTQTEALKQAISRLEWFIDSYPHDITTSKEDFLRPFKKALMSFQDGAQPEQEPVAWMLNGFPYKEKQVQVGGSCRGQEFPNQTPLYTTTPQRKPLTNEEIERLRIEQEFDQWAISEGAFKYAARAIEAAHGIKE